MFDQSLVSIESLEVQGLEMLLESELYLSQRVILLALTRGGGVTVFEQRGGASKYFGL